MSLSSRRPIVRTFLGVESMFRVRKTEENSSEYAVPASAFFHRALSAPAGPLHKLRLI